MGPLIAWLASAPTLTATVLLLYLSTDPAASEGPRNVHRALWGKTGDLLLSVLTAVSQGPALRGPHSPLVTAVGSRNWARDQNFLLTRLPSVS